MHKASLGDMAILSNDIVTSQYLEIQVLKGTLSFLFWGPSSFHTLNKNQYETQMRTLFVMILGAH